MNRVARIRCWNLERDDSLAAFIGRVNRARHENPALQRDAGMRFFPVDNEQLVCYGKTTAGLDNVVIVVANLDPVHTRSGDRAFGTTRLRRSAAR